jgi:hypothetical protein
LPLSESKSGIEIMTLLAQRMKYEWPYTGPADAFLEWHGKSYQELEDFGELI